MLATVGLRNFFSFGEEAHTITLNQGANILVGINGTGKSNSIKALQFLYQTVSGEKNYYEIFSEWGGLDEILNKSIEAKKEFLIGVEFDKDWLNQNIKNGFVFSENVLFMYIFKKENDIMVLKEEGLFYHDEMDKTSFHFQSTKYIRSAPFDKTAEMVDYEKEFVWERPILAQITERDRERFLPLYTIKQAILQMAVYFHFDTSRESKIRALSKIYSEKKLLSNGVNLVHLLNTLSTKQLVAYEKIEEHLGKINPNFKSLTFSVPMGNQILMSLREKNMQHVIPINQISNGTLQYLLLLAILCNPDKGKLICIDELENGLHPDMIKTICDLIKLAIKDGTQFFIATHSPLILNNFDIEDLIIFEKDENNHTYAVKKTEEDFPEWEGEFLAGQMWLRGQLGGKRW